MLHMRGHIRFSGLFPKRWLCRVPGRRVTQAPSAESDFLFTGEMITSGRSAREGVLELRQTEALA